MRRKIGAGMAWSIMCGAAVRGAVVHAHALTYDTSDAAVTVTKPAVVLRECLYRRESGVFGYKTEILSGAMWIPLLS